MCSAVLCDYNIIYCWKLTLFQSNGGRATAIRRTRVLYLCVHNVRACLCSNKPLPFHQITASPPLSKYWRSEECCFLLLFFGDGKASSFTIRRIEAKENIYKHFVNVYIVFADVNRNDGKQAFSASQQRHRHKTKLMPKWRMIKINFNSTFINNQVTSCEWNSTPCFVEYYGFCHFINQSKVVGAS